jgi:hypothetical protein
MVVVCCMVIGCVDVSRLLHFTLHSHISHQLRDVLLMDPILVVTSKVTSHMRVLKYETHK